MWRGDSDMSQRPSGTGSTRSRAAPGRMARRFKFVRVLRRDRPFAVMLGLGVLVVGAVLAAVPKVWRTTPDPFPFGVVRVSAVDLVQAWSLARSARRAAAAGEFEAALFAWRGALANNMGAAPMHRDVLRFLRDMPEASSDRSLFAMRSATWLMALTRTNVAELALIGEVMERHGRPRVALAWLAGIPEGQDMALEKVRARCLLSAGMPDAFAARWRAHEPVWKDDPILGLYRDAWVAMTDDRTAGLSATVGLKAALGLEGEPGLAAARLLAMVAAAKGQADDLGLALETLEARGSATAAQHGYYWRVLAASGRVEEAEKRAEAYVAVPADPEMAVALWRSLWQLGKGKPEKREETLQRVGAALERYGNTLEVWRTYFDFLAEDARWREVLRAAANARMTCSRLEPLFVEILFAEYRAAVGEGRRAEEDRLAAELAGMRVGEGETLVRVASGLRVGGRSGYALRLLQAHEGGLKEVPGYWAEVFSAGLGAKDLEVLRRSAGELLRIEPGNRAWLNNRAALLLITGEEPAEALRLTLEGMSRNPGLVSLKINHAMALVVNDRAAEAEVLLGTIPVSKLPPDAKANYHLAMAQANLALGRMAQAMEAAGQADRSRLLRPQVERLDRILEAAAGGGVR